jgi:hypothetical protein
MGARGPKPGTVRKTGGRKKGTPNRRTQALRQQMQATAEAVSAVVPNAFDGDSHALLVAIYKDPSHPIELRLDAAKAAIGYERRLAWRRRSTRATWPTP